MRPTHLGLAHAVGHLRTVFPKRRNDGDFRILPRLPRQRWRAMFAAHMAHGAMLIGKDALAAALNSGFTRFRPVLMTALAMIIGMVPMALGLGEGGEQNAPLGRAVIGGLLFATVATLFFVPVFFSILHGRRQRLARGEAKH